MTLLLTACSASSSGAVDPPGATGAAGGGGASAGGSGGSSAGGLSGGGGAALPSCDAPTSGPDVVFEDAYAYLNAVAVDDSGIYLAAETGLIALPPGGGAGVTLYPAAGANALYIRRLALGGGSLFAAIVVPGSLDFQEGIVAITPAGTVTDLASPIFFGELAADADGNVFGGGRDGTQGVVWSFSSTGAAGPSVTTTAVAPVGTGGPIIHELRVFGTELFAHVNHDGQGAQPAHAQIERGVTSGGDTTVVVVADSDITALAVDAAFLYWAEAGASPSIRRSAHDGSNVTTVAMAAATSLASDGTSLFATTADGVLQLSPTTLASTTLAAAQSQPRGLVEHGARVFWITEDAGTHATAARSACKHAGP